MCEPNSYPINWEALQQAAQIHKNSNGKKGDLCHELLNAWNAIHPDQTISSPDRYQWQICREQCIDELDALKPDWRGYLCSYQKSKS